MIERSIPELLAASHGIACKGPHRCFYCGAPCDGTSSVKEYVAKSFTARSTVANPGSLGICEGCVLAMREGATICMIDGEERIGQKMRGYSWVLLDGNAFAATKAHLKQLRETCLALPEPPFAIVLSDSGQTHQLYRGVANHSSETVTVTLEAERVTYRPEELRGRLALCGKLVAATGKPALKGPVSVRFAISVSEYFRDGESLVEEWDRVREQPLSRLAAWLCPNKESCSHEYASDTGHGIAPPQAGGDGGPIGKVGREHGESRDSRGVQPLLFDLGEPVR